MALKRIEIPITILDNDGNPLTGADIYVWPRGNAQTNTAQRIPVYASRDLTDTTPLTQPLQSAVGRVNGVVSVRSFDA